jgi:hypothetical protein
MAENAHTGQTSRSSRRAAVFMQHAPLTHATRLIVELARLGTLLTQWWWVCGQTCRRRPREPLWSVVVQVRRLEQQLNLPPICSAFCMRPRRPQRTREAWHAAACSGAGMQPATHEGATQRRVCTLHYPWTDAADACSSRSSSHAYTQARMRMHARSTVPGRAACLRRKVEAPLRTR